MVPKLESLTQAQVEGTEGTREIDVRRNGVDWSTCLARVCARASGQGIPLGDEDIQLIAVFYLAPKRIAREQWKPGSAGSVNCSAGQISIRGNARAECIDGSNRESKRKLCLSVERQALVFIGERVTFFLAQAGCTFRKIHLFVRIVIRKLIVVGVVKRLRQRIADV